ncbi:hypothetical protein [Jeotgalibaca porci]|uniref:crAss001_48 related protein n=1 Tax=Jeotgalibaca porci TaxID=1868793 RepID=UPI0035A01D11
MQLNETIKLMNSDDYQDRFKAEYKQLSIRLQGLERMLYMYEMDKLSFEPKCSQELLASQALSMRTYQAILEERARIENIQLYQVG